MPKHIPQAILKHFMRTQVEVIGRTDVYAAGGNHIGSNDQVTVNTDAFRQGVAFEKRVVVSTDGETIEVTLDKSCLFGCQRLFTRLQRPAPAPPAPPPRATGR